ncbi:MAG: hypothetical protein K6E78_03635 [Treponema sp.]|nr:hypothetical protein [Treponema sp.]
MQHEFEDRANLFTLLERLQEFLEIKRNFFEIYGKSGKIYLKKQK